MISDNDTNNKNNEEEEWRQTHFDVAPDVRVEFSILTFPFIKNYY